MVAGGVCLVAGPRAITRWSRVCAVAVGGRYLRDAYGHTCWETSIFVAAVAAWALLGGGGGWSWRVAAGDSVGGGRLDGAGGGSGGGGYFAVVRG